MSVPKNLPLINFGWPQLPVGEAAQNGAFELLQAQADWLARVGMVVAPEMNQKTTQWMKSAKRPHSPSSSNAILRTPNTNTLAMQPTCRGD